MEGRRWQSSKWIKQQIDLIYIHLLDDFSSKFVFRQKNKNFEVKTLTFEAKTLTVEAKNTHLWSKNTHL